MKKTKEIPIGGIGMIYGMRVMAMEYQLSNSCDDCCFSRNANYHRDCPLNKCNAKNREDHKHIYFVEVKQ